MSGHQYTNNEYYDMILCVGASRNSNLAEARDIYRQKFIDGKPPDKQRYLPPYSAFRTLCTRLQSTGSAHPDPRDRLNLGREPSKKTLSLKKKILKLFEDDPRTSTRRAGALLGVGHSQVWRILHKSGHHAVQILDPPQEPTPVYCQHRLKFCTWFRNCVVADPNFANKVLWTGEASFNRKGVIKLHNDENHGANESNLQHQWTIRVWAGILADRILGPFFLPLTVNGKVYLNLLSKDIEEVLSNLPLTEYINIIYQHDNASAHDKQQVRRYLDAMYPGNWIGKKGPIAWPGRSPDLTPHDFFLWDYVKNNVYTVECHTRDDMQERILEAFASITPQMLQNTRKSLLQRIYLCLEEKGKYFDDDSL